MPPAPLTSPPGSCVTRSAEIGKLDLRGRILGPGDPNPAWKITVELLESVCHIASPFGLAVHSVPHVPVHYRNSAVT
jgi:hypothetical protein